MGFPGPKGANVSVTGFLTENTCIIMHTKMLIVPTWGGYSYIQHQKILLSTEMVCSLSLTSMICPS